MTWDDRELDGDDVVVGEELEVGVADAYLARSNEHFVGADGRLGHLGDLGDAGPREYECLHDVVPPTPRTSSMYNRLHKSTRGPEMKAARYHGRHDIRIEELPIPTPADDELLVQVTAVGICGTDAAEFANGPTLFSIDQSHPITGHSGPLVPGHEFAGIVVRAGSGTAGFAEGDLITSGAGVSCGSCRHCRAGRTNLCARYYTVGLNRDGALAEFTTVPSGACLNVSERRLSGDVSALAQPMSIAVHATRRGGPRQEDGVVVVGAGGIGSFVVHAAVRTGAHVTAIDVDADRLAVARELGASATVHTTRDAALDDVLGALPTTPTVIYECTGLPAAVQAAIRTVEPGGRVVAVGLHKHPVPIDLLQVSLHEKEVVGTVAHVFGADLEHAVDLLEDGKGLWAHVAPTVVPLDDLVDRGLRPMIEGGETPIKLLLDPRIAEVRPLEIA
jgi:(R,R)-butanediol dehydrogenase/meso-butanediol dehydrogenase/diacetyl reductase